MLEKIKQKQPEKQKKQKKSKKPKAQLFIYLGTSVAPENIYWVLLNESEIIHQGKGVCEALVKLSKEYKTNILVRAENAVLISAEAPLGIKTTEYSMLLEDEFLGDLDANIISLVEKRKTEFQGQILDFALIEKSFLLQWQELFIQESINFKNFYFDLSYLKDSLENKFLIFSDLEEQDLYVHKKVNGALSWLVWDKQFNDKLPPNLQTLLEDETLRIERFSNTAQRVHKLFETKANPLILKVPKIKSDMDLSKKLGFLKNIKLPSFAFLKKPVFWFFGIFAALGISYFVLQNNLAEKSAIAQIASIDSLKMHQELSNQELLMRIEAGASNYPKAKQRLNKINSIVNRVNSRLSKDIFPLEVSWDNEKIVFVLSLINEEDSQMLQGLTKNMQVFDYKARLEFKLN